tara:strand:- start:49 stop:291 length:243 start_codon:yes stop_codon:yes gene_type:complete
MICRKGCGACCIFLDISSSIPNHPSGKPSGVKCKNLDDEKGCMLHWTKDYPNVCNDYKAETEFCGNTFEDAKNILVELSK